MELRHLQTFHAVLREGSFLKAARVLGLAQPTVTLHIQEMESELGLPLFDRSGRQRQKTAAGELLAARALPILDAVESLVRSMGELRDGKSGVLRAASIEPAASRRLMPLVARLHAQRPGLTVLLETGGTSSVSRAVAAGDVDLGVCSAPPVELGLAFERLFEEEVVLLVPNGHRLARARRVTAADLEGQPLALTEQGCAYRRAVETALAAKGIRPAWAFQSGSSASLRAAASHGLGLAFLPRLAATPAPAGTVIRRLHDVPIALPAGLVTRPGARPSPIVSAFVAALREECDRPAGRRIRKRPGGGRAVP